MLLSVIENIVSDKFDELNARLNSDIKINHIVSSADIDKITYNEKYINYALYVSEVNELDDYETPDLNNVNVKLEFIFRINSKNYNIYKTLFDRYIYNYKRLLKDINSNSSHSDSIQVINITNISITNADRFEDEYYKPSISFTLLINDSGFTNIDIKPK